MKIIGFDTETTGVDTNTARIVSAALVEKREDGSFRGREVIIDPGVEIPEAASNIHGMTTEFVRENGGNPVVELKKISKVLNSADQIVIFNASYDLPLLEKELERHGLPPLDKDTSRKVVDPLVIDRHYDRYRKGKRTLGAAAAHYNVEVEGDLHNALTDVETMLKVLEKIEEKYPQFSEMDREERFEAQAKWHREFAESLNKWKGENIVDRSWLNNRQLRNYHLSPDGKTGKCEAKYKCPFDETGEHFETKQEAERAAEKFLTEQHGLFSITEVSE